MIIFSLFIENVLSPVILFFLLGCLAGFIKSDLIVPDSISRYLSLYLMMAIGFKGGVALAEIRFFNLQIIFTLLTGLGIGFFQPFIGYVMLKLTTRLDRETAAAVAAHYGSISVVTFLAAANFLQGNQVFYGGYIVAVLALMEAPAILSGLFIANQGSIKNFKNSNNLRDIFTNGSLLLLLGSFLIGLLSGRGGLEKMEGFLETPFQGILAFFLLDMGLMISKQRHHLKAFTFGLFLFGVYMPLIGGMVGVFASKILGLDAGTGTLFAVLCASASYIAVPAAMRVALPQAKAAIYLPMSLAITFPFNITLGVPLYFIICRYILG
jgi:uncharacterized protein